MFWEKNKSDGLNLLSKKTSRELNENEINLSDKYKKNNYEYTYKSVQKTEKERCIQILGENKENKINREKGEKIIYEVLNEVLNSKILNDKNIFEKYEKYKHNDIYNLIQTNDISLYLLALRSLAHKIEENLYKLYKNRSSSYDNFLLEFSQCRRKSFDLIIKIIFGEYTPEEISNFKDEDFLSEEERKEKEEKKKIEINKMLLTGDKEVKLTLNKGRMLSEKEIYIEDKNNNNIDIFMNEQKDENDERYDDDKAKKYKEKLINKQAEFPHLKKEDLKMLIDLTNPNEEDIKDKLNNLIQENLEVNEQSEFFDKRKKILIKEAERRIKNSEKNNVDMLINDENDNKINNCIENISFDIRYYGMN